MTATPSSTTTIRVRLDTREALAAIAKREGRPITEVVARLVDEHEANVMFDRHTDVMTRLGTTPDRQAELDAEQRLLDGTLLDGLDRDPWPLDEHGHPAR
jgi:hypothetical protein